MEYKEYIQNDNEFYYACGNLIRFLSTQLDSNKNIQEMYNLCFSCNTSIKLIQAIDKITTIHSFDLSHQYMEILNSILNYRLVSYVNRPMLYQGLID